MKDSTVLSLFFKQTPEEGTIGNLTGGWLLAKELLIEPKKRLTHPVLVRKWWEGRKREKERTGFQGSRFIAAFLNEKFSLLSSLWGWPVVSVLNLEFLLKRKFFFQCSNCESICSCSGKLFFQSYCGSLLA